MHFIVHASAFRCAPETLSLTEVWNIEEPELSPIGVKALGLLDSKEFAHQQLREEAAWEGQALLEFQDLQDLTLPKEGPFFNVNYLFFEALSALRESIVSGLNGQLHAAFAVLRSAVELFTFHYWWKKRLQNTDTYKEFYDWLFGQRKSAPFANVVNESFQMIDLPERELKKEELKKIYSKLCSYAHKPLIDEAITTIRGGNRPSANPGVLEYWLRIVHSTQRCLLDLSISNGPQSLFPVQLLRKFGFNPPVGLFFDHSNYLSIEQALGADSVVTYRRHYERKDPPSALLDWFNSLKDLSDEEILASWENEEQIDDGDEPFEERVFMRYTIFKAKMRVTLGMFAYERNASRLENLLRDVKG